MQLTILVVFFRKDTNDYEKGKMKFVESLIKKNHNYLQQSLAFNKRANINNHEIIPQNTAKLIFHESTDPVIPKLHKYTTKNF